VPPGHQHRAPPSQRLSSEQLTKLPAAKLEALMASPNLSQPATWFDRALDATATDEIFGAH
jgi:hypothetical protein